MKLATIRDGSRDGQLVVVSRDLRHAHFPTGITDTLQRALDDWNFISPQLQDLYDALNSEQAREAFPFDPSRCMAPLPRPGHYLAAVQGEPQAGDEGPMLEYRGGEFLGARDVMQPAGAASGAVLEAGMAAILGDVPAGLPRERAAEAVRLLTLASQLVLSPGVDGDAGAAVVDPVQARPCAAFGPLAVTPDEFGPAWRGGRLRLDLSVRQSSGAARTHELAAGMRRSFAQLVAHAASTRKLPAGTLIAGEAVAQVAVVLAPAADPVTTEDGADTPPQIADTVRVELAGRGPGAPSLGRMEHVILGA